MKPRPWKVLSITIPPELAERVFTDLERAIGTPGNREFTLDIFEMLTPFAGAALALTQELDGKPGWGRRDRKRTALMTIHTLLSLYLEETARLPRKTAEN